MQILRAPALTSFARLDFFWVCVWWTSALVELDAQNGLGNRQLQKTQVRLICAQWELLAYLPVTSVIFGLNAVALTGEPTPGERFSIWLDTDFIPPDKQAEGPELRILKIFTFHNLMTARRTQSIHQFGFEPLSTWSRADWSPHCGPFNFRSNKR